MFNAGDLSALLQIRGSIENTIEIIEKLGVEVNNDFLRGFMLADVLRSTSEIATFLKIYFPNQASEANLPNFPEITATGEGADFQKAIDYLKDFEAAFKRVSKAVADIEPDPIDDHILLNELNNLTNPEG